MQITGGRVVLFALVVGLGAVVLRRGGAGPFGRGGHGWADEIDGEPVQRIAGAEWRFEAPSGRWYTSRRMFPGFEDDREAQVEKVLARPEGGAVACLVSRRSPGDGRSGLDALTDEISRVWASRFRSARLLETSSLPGRGTRVLHMSARIDGEDFEALWALYANPPRTYAFMAGAPARDFPLLRSELEAILASFQADALPPDPSPTLTYIQKSFSDIRDIGTKPRPGAPPP